jgi:hypothetical protein
MFPVQRDRNILWVWRYSGEAFIRFYVADNGLRNPVHIGDLTGTAGVAPNGYDLFVGE